MKKEKIFISLLFLSQVLASPQEEMSHLPKDIIRPSIEYKAEGLKDPFRRQLKEEKKTHLVSQEERLSELEKPIPALTVQGVIWGGNFPQAIINNKVVKVGDTIEGVQVIDINKDGLTVVFQNRQYNLSSPARINLQSLPKKSQEARYNEE